MLWSCDPNALIDQTAEIDSITSLNIRLTDAPIDLDEVNIDLQQVIIKGSEGTQEIPLETNAGIYNLLDLQNGIDALIANAEIQLGQLTEVRLLLGANNTVVVDGESFELKIPSGSQSGLKIKLCLDLTDMPQYDLILDFDAAESVHITGNGKYIMKPVIKIKNPDAQCDGGGEEEGEEDDGEEDGGVSIDDLPETVVDFLNENYEGYDFTIGTQTFCDGTETYLLQGKKGSNTILLYYDLSWDLWLSATSFDEADLPTAVLEAIAADYENYKIMNNKAWEMVKAADGSLWYRVYLKKNNSSEKFYVIYAEDGTFICRED
jgi:hypothetical protein